MGPVLSLTKSGLIGCSLAIFTLSACAAGPHFRHAIVDKSSMEKAAAFLVKNASAPTIPDRTRLMLGDGMLFQQNTITAKDGNTALLVKYDPENILTEAILLTEKTWLHNKAEIKPELTVRISLVDIDTGLSPNGTGSVSPVSKITLRFDVSGYGQTIVQDFRCVLSGELESQTKWARQPSLHGEKCHVVADGAYSIFSASEARENQAFSNSLSGLMLITTYWGLREIGQKLAATEKD